jgi:uncharacterized membrane protein YkoI
MPKSVTIALVLVSLTGSPLAAADEHPCLTRAEQRVAVSRGQAVPLAAAIKAARGHSRGRQVVKAQLCREPKGLVYVLTVLARDGKVARLTVDAVKGTLVGGL